jgi:hypothetical protein
MAYGGVGALKGRCARVGHPVPQHRRFPWPSRPQTREDGTVTIRDRDSMKQDRIPGDPKALLAYIQEHLQW